MSRRERIIHTALFEVLLLSILIPATAVFTDHGAGSMTVGMVGIAIMAMIWNYLFNLGFDRLFGVRRIQRGPWLRIVHTVTFEAGLLVPTVPYLAWVLDTSMLEAFVIDSATVLFVLVYAFVFNWVYDRARRPVVLRHRHKQRAKSRFENPFYFGGSQ